MEPLMLTHVGLRVPALILPATLQIFISPIAEYTPKGDYFSTVTMTHINRFPVQPQKRITPISFDLLDVNAFNPSIANGDVRYAVVILNCGGDERNLKVPVNFFAIAIWHLHGDGVLLKSLSLNRRMQSTQPINFRLNKSTGLNDMADSVINYAINCSELEYHGMQFLSMYF
ncbi:hypothetical protein BDN70DRAFT_360499 [Pholiota conissans]|uniref:Uncharacterized protein n=1 Tax=Pholiota conissans TaxID=109636 RepID=A0A9P6D4G4_9AGAR|nr:hypothetical protein BDN70DRAFT_360499 [Pholiota conissans]